MRQSIAYTLSFAHLILSIWLLSACASARALPQGQHAEIRRVALSRARLISRSVAERPHKVLGPRAAATNTVGPQAIGSSAGNNGNSSGGIGEAEGMRIASGETTGEDAQPRNDPRLPLALAALYVQWFFQGRNTAGGIVFSQASARRGLSPALEMLLLVRMNREQRVAYYRCFRAAMTRHPPAEESFVKLTKRDKKHVQRYCLQSVSPELYAAMLAEQKRNLEADRAAAAAAADATQEGSVPGAEGSSNVNGNTQPTSADTEKRGRSEDDGGNRMSVAASVAPQALARGCGNRVRWL